MLGRYVTDRTLPMYGGLIVEGTGRKVDAPHWGGVLWEFELANPHQRELWRERLPEGKILVRSHKLTKI